MEAFNRKCQGSRKHRLCQIDPTSGTYKHLAYGLRQSTNWCLSLLEQIEMHNSHPGLWHQESYATFRRHMYDLSIPCLVFFFSWFSCLPCNYCFKLLSWLIHFKNKKGILNNALLEVVSFISFAMSRATTNLQNVLMCLVYRSTSWPYWLL